MILTLQRVRKSSCTSATVINKSFSLPFNCSTDSSGTVALAFRRRLLPLTGITFSRLHPLPFMHLHIHHHHLHQHNGLAQQLPQLHFNSYSDPQIKMDRCLALPWQHRRAMQITPSARKNSVPVFRLSKSFNCLKNSNFIQSEIKEILSLHCSAAF